MAMRCLSAGDRALLVELDGLEQALALFRAARGAPIAGVRELVPAARTLLVQYDPEITNRSDLVHALAARHDAAARTPADAGAAARTIRIPVHYNGADLAEVAELLKLTEREVIARHTGAPWQAAFAGFAPGFVYLAGGDPCFAAIPRRPTPRLKVPAGAVALAGNLSAVYPSASPGGWQLIGRTDWRMWDLRRAVPALIQPGMRVRFVDADAPGARLPRLPQAARAKAVAASSAHADWADATTIEILAPGLQTLVQDGGRHQQTQLGISASGALDRGALHEANARVGNPSEAAVLENVLGGLHLRCAGGDALLAVAGARAPVTVRAADGRERRATRSRAIALHDGETLEIGRASAGVRCTVAVRGGWHVGALLGSSSTDTLAGIGPPALRAHAHIAVGQAIPADQLRAPSTARAPRRPLPKPGDTVTLDVIPGPRCDWFTPEAQRLLAEQPWRVTPQCDRVGMRLHGAQPLARRRDGELPSEGTVTGAIQVPASGQPVLFLADHPLTGGYPVIAVVIAKHLDLVAQIPIGCRIRFRIVQDFFAQHRP